MKVGTGPPKERGKKGRGLNPVARASSITGSVISNAV